MQMIDAQQDLPKKNPKLIFLIIGIVVVLILGGVGIYFFQNRPGGAKEVTLTYWGLWEPEAVMSGVIDEFERNNPNIKINYLRQDKEDYRARLQSAFARNEGPDIFRFHQTWIPMLVDDLAPVPQTAVNELGLETEYFPIVSQSLSRQGQFYGLPLMIDALALYYNKDLLTAANISPPRTWWGLEQAAKKLAVQTGNRITTGGVAMGTTNNVCHWSDIIGLMIYQNEGNPARADFLTEDVINYYLKFDKVNQVWDDAMPYSTLAFATEKLAFYFGPSWRVFNIKEANPNLNFGITNVPQLPKVEGADWERAEAGEEELTNIGWSTFWAEGVWNKSPNQEEAWKFLTFLSMPETMQKLYTAQSHIREFGEIYPRINLAEQIQDPYVRPFVEEIKNAKTWYMCSFTHDEGINDRIINYYENAVNLISERGRSKEALDNLQNGIDQILGQYRLAN